jgi:hypothetical protein
MMDRPNVLWHSAGRGFIILGVLFLIGGLYLLGSLAFEASMYRLVETKGTPKTAPIVGYHEQMGTGGHTYAISFLYRSVTYTQQVTKEQYDRFRHQDTVDIMAYKRLAVVRNAKPPIRWTYSVVGVGLLGVSVLCFVKGIRTNRKAQRDYIAAWKAYWDNNPT